ncbi:DUF2306 domain-containing protein [Ferruginibacter sp. SUN002]|uniref:DUF2306 domain-containing protein n=1 Tax=Ferruginibacter sp. SUN002 TaxID=2937789 RepID=UPI003D36499C
MVRIIIPYHSLQTDIGFLQLKQAVIHIDVWRVSFFTHVFTSFFVLIAGFTQFSKKLLKQRPVLHRRLGYFYVINILFITGPAGLIMSFYANGGVNSIIGFTLLSVLWIGTTAMALYKAIKKDFIAHRAFMIRSFALTLSAISLRAEKVLFAEFTNIAPMDRYRIIAWLGWGLNLIIAEIIIYQLHQKRKIKNLRFKTEVNTI